MFFKFAFIIASLLSLFLILIIYLLRRACLDILEEVEMRKGNLNDYYPEKDKES